jgi:dTMP kinase
MDRYAYSGVAFSSAKDVAGMTLDWCRAPDAGLPRPDVLFFMDIPVEKAAARGGFGEERYEDPVFQARVRARFDTLRVEASAAAGGGGGLDGGAGSPPPPIWVNVDAAGTIEAIHAHLMDLTREVVAQAAARPVRKLWTGEVL